MADAAVPLRAVELRKLPVSLARRAARHQTTVERELRLVGVSGTSTGDRRLHELAAELLARAGELPTGVTDRVDAAWRRGATEVDVRLEVPPSVAPAAARLGVLLDEVDDHSRRGALLTPPLSPDATRYRHWYLRQLERQVGGGAPEPWPASAGTEQQPSPPSAVPAEVAVEDELDLMGAVALRDALAALVARGVRDVTVDLSRCVFVDSVGLSVLLTARERLVASGGRLAVVGPRPAVARTLVVSGVADLLGLADA